MPFTEAVPQTTRLLFLYCNSDCVKWCYLMGLAIITVSRNCCCTWTQFAKVLSVIASFQTVLYLCFSLSFEWDDCSHFLFLHSIWFYALFYLCGVLLWLLSEKGATLINVYFIFIWICFGCNFTTCVKDNCVKENWGMTSWIIWLMSSLPDQPKQKNKNKNSHLLVWSVYNS